MKKNMINQLRDESKRATPDVKNYVLEKTSELQANAAQPSAKEISISKPKSYAKKSLFALIPICLIIIVLSIALPLGLTPNPTSPDIALIAFDINPKFELIIKDNIVQQVNSLNTDSIVFFTDFNVTKKPLEEAINLIVDNLSKDGYLKINSINVLATSNAQKVEDKYLDLTDSLLSNLKKNQAFEYRVIRHNELKKDAKSYKTTTNKLYLAKQACEKQSGLTLEDALKMTTSQLNHIMSNYNESILDFSNSYNKALEKLEKDFEDQKDIIEKRLEKIEEMIEKVEEGANYELFVDDLLKEFPSFNISEIKNNKQFINKVSALIKQTENKLESLERKYKQGLSQIKKEINEKLNNGADIDYDNDFNINYDDDDSELEDDDSGSNDESDSELDN